ncbi:hypothetical protein EDD16DRAFT_377835 [Pisolithus croceorrhizus]|nr:hypothetical protein EDD16DRAFT_377835 [Pisolithus croceorrhizus]
MVLAEMSLPPVFSWLLYMHFTIHLNSCVETFEHEGVQSRDVGHVQSNSSLQLLFKLEYLVVITALYYDKTAFYMEQALFGR